MKVFAQQLRSKPQFIAVFKVRHKSYELFQDFKAFQNSIEQALVLLKPHNPHSATSFVVAGVLQLPFTGVHDRGLDHGCRDRPHLHLPLLASPGCILYFVFCILYFVFCILYFVFCILYFVFCNTVLSSFRRQQDELSGAGFGVATQSRRALARLVLGFQSFLKH